MPKPKRGLGKGLEALFADNDTADVAVSTLSIAEIEPNSEQPRREFSPEELDSLAASIREHGVLQPLVVRPRPNGRYQIVAGERRWRASRIAGLTELPVVI
ncbi:MAG: stage 0 sporulation protein J, partial [Oscillospiraceae bacterium]